MEQSRANVTFSDLLVQESPAPRELISSRALRRKANVAKGLEKSLQMLDEAVGSPAEPPKPKLLMDVDSGFVKPEIPGPFSDSFMDTSVVAGERSLFGQGAFDAADATADFNTTNVAVLLSENPEIAESDSLHGEFVRLACSVTNPLELTAEFGRLCRQQTTLLGRLLPVASQAHSRYRKVAYSQAQLQSEYATWLLLTTLYAERLSDGQPDPEAPLNITGVGWSERRAVETMYEQDTTLREAQTVIDWLEQLSSERIPQEASREEFFTNRGQLGENTLHVLSGPQRGQEQKKVVSSLDPDAPLWQDKPLHALDAEDEARFLHHLFALARAGRLEEAQMLCVRCGQAWRAATLEGWKLHHDSNYSGGGELVPVEGNEMRQLWLQMARALAENPNLSVWERALYGVVSCHKESVLSVCSGWEDHLWTQLRCGVTERVEAELWALRGETGPHAHSSGSLDMNQVFKSIEASSPEMKKDSERVHPTIQRLLILGDIRGLLWELRRIAELKTTDPHTLRLAASLVLWTRQLGFSGAGPDELACETAVLEAYVAWLGGSEMQELVAPLAACLPHNRHVDCLAHMLLDVENDEARQEALQRATASGLDTAAVACRIVTLLRLKLKPAGPPATSESDRKLATAVDWLLHVPGQEAEGLFHSNAIARSFLGCEKLEACALLIQRLPVDLLGAVQASSDGHMTSGDQLMPGRTENAIREHLCIRAYLEAQELFNEWFTANSQQQQRAPARVERLATEAVQKLYNVLLFVGGGWMVDTAIDEDTPEEEASSRRHEMTSLRRLCLPRVVSLLHTVLTSSHRHTDTLRLAQVVADEQNRLYEVFSKSDLRTLVSQLARAAAQGWKGGNDPLQPSSRA